MIHRTLLTIAALFASFAAHAAAAETTPELAFRPGLPEWNIRLGKENIKLFNSPYGAAVEMRDDSRSKACNIESKFLPATPGCYQLSGKIKVTRDEGITIKVIFYDAAHRQLDMAETVWVRTPPDAPWCDFTLNANAAWPQTKYLKVFVYSWYPTRPLFAVAALELKQSTPVAEQPRWQPTFKGKGKATPDEITGADGINYPDFTAAGLRQPNKYHQKLYLRDFGARAVPGFDNYPALAQAISQADKNGGGEIFFDAGTYEIAHPVYVYSDNIAIRGAGRDRTRLKFTFSPGAAGIRFCFLQPGQTVGKKTSLNAIATAAGMTGMSWLVDGKPEKKWDKNASNGNASMDFICLDPQKHAPGRHEITAIAHYQNGSDRKCSIIVDFRPAVTTPEIPEKVEALLLFSGAGFTAERIALAKIDPKRGDKVIELKYSPKYRSGDLLKIEAPLTERWRNLVKSACRWGYFRDALIEVKWVNARRIGLSNPLRIDFPLLDNSFVQKLEAIRNCEVSGLSIEQSENLWLIGVFFKWAYNCRANGLYIHKAGRHPAHTYWSSHIEISDCEFDDVWDRDGGGAGYTSFEATFDSMMDRVTTDKMRHAPSFQWSSSGNVIRRGVFKNSDAHWHAGWTNNNLIEQCEISSKRGYGSYGYGMWASFPGDGGKGPNGPRNVVYNNDISSELGSVWLGGMNENWLICYNRFTTANGPGVFLQNHVIDTIIHGNVFKIKNPNSPLAMLRDPDCTGIELTGNVLIGGSAFAAGLIAPAVERGNKKYPYVTEIKKVTPQISVPSIYEWQMRKKGKMK